MSEASKPHSVRLMPDEIEAVESIAAKSGLAFALDHLGLDGLGNHVLDLHRRIRELEEQLEAKERELEALRGAVDVLNSIPANEPES